MPFIIAVLGIAVAISGVVAYGKKVEKQSSMRAKDMQKTNANLEQSLVDGFMKAGYSFDDAFDAAVTELVERGFSPCIPRTAYQHQEVDNKYRLIGEAPQDEVVEPMKSSFIEGVGFDNLSEQYDSFEVRNRRSLLRRQWKAEHGCDIPADELERRIYIDFPTSETEYESGLDKRAREWQAYPVGSYITYPNLGTCEVVGHNNIGSAGGTYKLKVLKTGQVVNYVKIGDKKIQLQG